MRRPRALFLQYTNPAGYPPLQHVADILLGDGWEVVFLGVDGGGGASRLRLRPHPRLAVHLMRGSRPGWRQKLNYFRYAAWALAWRVAWRPDCIYASDALGAPAALAATAWPVRCLIYHEHDAPPPPQGRFSRVVLALRRTIATRCTAIVVPNASRGAALLADTGADGRRLQCVWNCPSLHEVAPEAPRPAEPEFWLLFQGSIVPDRLPGSVIDALATLPPHVKLRVAGYETAGSPGYVRELLGRASDLGISDRVCFLGTLARDDLLAIMRRSHLGLAFMPIQPQDINSRHMTGASNKAFEYMASGCALLVSDLPDWVEMFVAPGFGIACDPRQPSSIAAAVQTLATQPGSARRMGERGRRAVLEAYHYEKCFAPVRQSIRGATASLS